MEKQWKSETFKDILNNPVSVCTKNFNSLKSRCRWAFYLIGFIAHDFCDFLNIWTFWNICDHNNIMWKGVGGLLSPQAHLSLGLPLYLIVFQWSRRGWRSAWKIREHFFLDTLNDKKKSNSWNQEVLYFISCPISCEEILGKFNTLLETKHKNVKRINI